MKRLLGVLALAIVAGAAIAQTITIPSQTVSVPAVAQGCVTVSTTPAQTLCAPGLTGTVIVAPPVCAASQVLQGGACVTPPPVVTPSGVAWLFHNGVKGAAWGGDFSYGTGSVSYTAKDPVTGEGVIAVTGDEGLQPVFLGSDFNTTGYNFVLVSFKPLVSAGQNWQMGAESFGDVPVPNAPWPPPVSALYCTAPQLGQWMTCKIPLTAYGIGPVANLGIHIYKLGFQQQLQPVTAGKVNWEAKEIGVSP